MVAEPLPTAVTAPLLAGNQPQPELRDAWGSEIVVVANPSRYVVISLGSDRKLDLTWDEEAFRGEGGDIIFSNGEWLHHPMLATGPGLPPKPEDALFEARECAPGAFDPQGRIIDASGSESYVYNFYLYLQSREAATAAAADVTKLGFSADVHRSAKAPHWICLATKRLAFKEQFSLVRDLARVERRNGGCPKCSL